MPRPTKRARSASPPAPEDAAPPAPDEPGVSYEEGLAHIERRTADYLGVMRAQWKIMWKWTQGNLELRDLDERMNDVFANCDGQPFFTD